MASPHAFVTLVSSDAYLPGALTQVAALNVLHEHRDFHTLCLVTPESVDVATIKALRRVFDVVVGVEILEHADERGLKLLGRPDLTTVLTKLHVFRLTQYSKIIFLDADVLPLRPLAHLFDLSHEFSAVPDVGWPDIFNSGVLVLSPGEDKFNQLNQLLKSKGSWDGGDQGLLNEWRGGDWHRLSFTYNTTPTAAYTYAPAYERYGSQISALHFIGKNKPWNTISSRSPFTTRSSAPRDTPQQAYDYDSLVDRWYAVYDKHYRSRPVSQASSFQFKRYTSAWDESRSQMSPGQPTGVLDLDALRQLTVEGIATSMSGDSRRTGEGVYFSLPLEGRIDLMRPPKPKVEKPVDENASAEEGPSHRGDRCRSSNLNFELEEVLPSTPQLRTSALYGEDEEGIYRWHTLPTPHPNDVPPNPYIQSVSLPPTSTPRRFDPVKSDFYASESDTGSNEASDHLLLQERQVHEHHLKPHDGREVPSSQPSSRLASQSYHRPFQFSHVVTPSQERPYQHHHHGHTHNLPSHAHHTPSKPPASPPLVAWNPALEPPPNNIPPLSAFPVDTYFPNLWDQLQSHKPLERSGSSTINFFQPPPTPEIPQRLVKEGHYRNVTGEDSLSPSPDRAKVKYIFPWEERPRTMPNRVFPDADAPPPALFLSPGSPSQTSTAAPSTPEQPKATPLAKIHPLSPLIGLPPALTYSNAWDTVPSIQKYASKLVRPSHLPPAPLAPAFDDERWRKSRPKNWDERMEASSRDGDDEDNADDEEDEDEDDYAADTKWDDSENESGKGPRQNLKTPKKPSKKEYRDQAIQTAVSSLRSQSSQTEKTARKASIRRQSIATSSPSFLVPPSTRDASASTAIDRPSSIVAPIAERPVLSGRPSKLSMRSAGGSPSLSPRIRSPMRSPVREFIVPPPPPSTNHPRPAITRMSTAPTKPTVRTAAPFPQYNGHNDHRLPSVSRQASNDSSITSPTSSSTNGFPDFQNPGDRTRVGGRVFDPARGVEIFKRGSEEVLARFLRMGNWENETIR